MKKIIFPALLIMLSGLVFSACTKAGNQAAVTEQEQQQDGSFNGTIKDLMGANKAQKCIWETAEQGSSTVYVDGKKTRAESDIPAMGDQPAQQMIAITDPEWSYSWNPVTKKGMKVKIEEADLNEVDPREDGEVWEDAAGDAEYMETINQDFEFKCESWKADAKMFFPPTDVNFTDMNAMMEGVKQNLQEMKKVCDMLSGEDKAECLAGFEE